MHRENWYLMFDLAFCPICWKCAFLYIHPNILYIIFVYYSIIFHVSTYNIYIYIYHIYILYAYIYYMYYIYILTYCLIFCSIFRYLLWILKNRLFHLTLHKIWSFQLRISSVDVTKSAVSCRFQHIY